MSKARVPRGITDHDYFVIEPDDHHPEAEVEKLIINGTSISPGDYEVRIQWNRDNHIITEACLAGSNLYFQGGRSGAWASGTQTPAQSGSEHVSGSGTYLYIASFMRLHGDAYLSQAVFGTSIRLKDLYLDGDETVILFNNGAGSNRTLRCWGLCWAK